MSGGAVGWRCVVGVGPSLIAADGSGLRWTDEVRYAVVVPGLRPPVPIKGHLREKDAHWVPVDTTRLTELAREQASTVPGLPERLARVAVGAWECDAYVRFLASRDARGRITSVVLEDGAEQYVLDLDGDDRPVGVELLHVTMSTSHHQEDR